MPSCILWDKGKTKAGYGMFTPKGQKMHYYVHRLAWESVYGKIPEEMEIHHTCNNKACYNPAHLQITIRRNHPDTFACDNAQKTYCIHGHEFTDENTYWIKKKTGSMRRNCRKCRAESGRKQNNKRKLMRGAQ